MADVDATLGTLPPLPNSDTQSYTSILCRKGVPELKPLRVDHDAKRHQPKYHIHAMVLILIYVPLLVLPWILTCVIAKRPLSATSYFNSRGFEDSEIKHMYNSARAVNVMNSVGSLVTIPILSALIAQAAAAYSHKHRSNPNFRLQHLVALADRGWTDPIALARSWRWPRRGSGVRYLLHFASLLVLLGSIQQPLSQLLVPMESFLVPRCQDTSYMHAAYYDYHPRCSNTSSPKVMGWDIEPTQMSLTSQDDIFQHLVTELATVSLIDAKLYLWNNASDPQANRQMVKDISSESFIAGFEQATSTGTLRNHIMRLNSSVTCARIQRAEFPSVCGGDRPFVRNVSHGNSFTKVCVPGRFGISPWTLSRDRQDIFEELYLDVLEGLEHNIGSLTERNVTSDYTLRCTASTTRGYFELGNYGTGYYWGPLLEKWPDPEVIKNNYNDFFKNSFPSEFANDPANSTNPSALYVSGPLTMAAITLFGNNTFFDIGTSAWDDAVAANNSTIMSYSSLCGLVPFVRLDPDGDKKFPECRPTPEGQGDGQNLKEHLATWLHGFNDTESANTAMTVAVFLANEAILTMDHWNAIYSSESALRNDRGRTIYGGYGIAVRRPKLTTNVVATMTSVLALELLGLALLAWLIYRQSSETRTLDVMAFSALKARMEEEQRAMTEEVTRQSTYNGSHSVASSTPKASLA